MPMRFFLVSATYRYLPISSTTSPEGSDMSVLLNLSILPLSVPSGENTCILSPPSSDMNTLWVAVSTAMSVGSNSLFESNLSSNSPSLSTTWTRLFPASSTKKRRSSLTIDTGSVNFRLPLLPAEPNRLSNEPLFENMLTWLLFFSTT